MIHREEGMTKLDRKWISHTSEIGFPDSEFPLPLWIWNLPSGLPHEDAVIL